MRITGSTPECWKWDIIDLDANKILRPNCCFYADDEEGIWKQYALDEEGHFIIENGNRKIITHYGNIQLKKGDYD